MRFYDVVADPELVGSGICKEIGLDLVFLAPGKGERGMPDAPAYLSDGRNATTLLKSGAKCAVADVLEIPTDLPQYMKAEGIPILVPLHGILASASFERVRLIRKTSRFYNDMRKSGVTCIFVSMAASADYLLSRMQLSSLSLMLGGGREKAVASNGMLPSIFGD
ncbi:MAG: hypothetical protein M1164_00180 [Candidatus Marsarchaeota archaeon]|jgi:hypothetical protein|nr:hypothetical protein [Candidatus Marsarchaeota archaeon]